jgi:hypothetical protein
MGLFAMIALSLPIIMLLVTRLAWYRSFPALFIYYFFVLAYTVLLLGYADLGKTFKYNLGVLNNFLDTPLMLLFLSYFSKTIFFRKKLMKATIGFIIFELVVISIYGFNLDSTTIILAPGLLMVLGISLLFFIHQVKIAVVYHRAVGKAVMIAAMLFSYVGFGFVYTVYYVIKPVYKDDAHLVYFLITTFSCIIMTAGIFIERKRVHHLSELQITRQELKAIYGSQAGKKIAGPLEPAMLNIDKKEWS